MTARGTDVHIASLVLQCRPADRDRVAAAAQRLPGVEIAAAEGGKLVVVLEAASERRVLDLTDALRDLPEALDCQLVYHHHEPAESLAEPVTPSEHEVRP